MPTLFVEFHGSDAGVAEQSQRFGEIVAELGGGPFDWATKPEDRTRLWQARHDALLGARRLAAGRAGFRDRRLRADLAAGRMRHRQPGRSPNSIWSRRSSATSATAISICSLLVDMADADEVAAPAILMERVVELALAMDGTCTGEHGVGQGKMKYLPAEHGAPALAAMAAIKRALDPQNIMNPGKIVALD